MKMTSLVLIASACLALSNCDSEVSKVKLIPGPQGENGHSLASLVAEIDAGLLCPSGGQSLDIYLDIDDSLSVTEGDEYLSSIVTCDGSNGLNGIDGLAGTDGQDGETGPQGDQGPQGIPGAQGPQGLAGATGADGQDGADGVDGVDGQDGATGPAGADGAQGPAGPAGTPGAPGADGEDGEDGTSVVIINYSSGSCTSIAGTTYYAKSGYLYDEAGCDHDDKVSMNSNEDSLWISASMLATRTSSAVRVVKFN
jgi:hypothetical protein